MYGLSMENQVQYALVLTTYPDEAAAKQFAQQLVEQKLGACVNVMPEMTSIYEWDGKLEQGRECQLIIKTQHSKLQALSDYILENHPYELPEILEIPISSGLPAYLNWISESLKG